MGQYMVIKPWGSGYKYVCCEGPRGTADEVMRNIGVEREARIERTAKGARPYGILVKVVEDERPPRKGRKGRKD